MTFGMPLSQWFNKNFTPLNPSIFGQCWQIYLLLATELWPIDFIITKSSYCSSHLLQGCQRLQDVLFYLFHLLENPDAHVLKYLVFFLHYCFINWVCFTFYVCVPGEQVLSPAGIVTALFCFIVPSILHLQVILYPLKDFKTVVSPL